MSEQAEEKAQKKDTRFKKGTVNNPHGRPKLPIEIREAKKMTREVLEQRLNDLLHTPKSTLESILGDPEAKALDLIVAGIIMRAVNDGCTQRLAFLLDRIVGRPKEIRIVATQEGIQNHIEASPKDEAPSEIVREFDSDVVHEDDVPTFIVAVNQRGKFVSPRPRLMQRKAHE